MMGDCLAGCVCCSAPIPCHGASQGLSFIRCRFASRIDSAVSSPHTRPNEAEKFNARSMCPANRQPHSLQFVSLGGGRNCRLRALIAAWSARHPQFNVIAGIVSAKSLPRSALSVARRLTWTIRNLLPALTSNTCAKIASFSRRRTAPRPWSSGAPNHCQPISLEPWRNWTLTGKG